MLWKTQKETTTAIIFKHDPLSLDCGCNSDEYDPEANAIIDRIWDVGMEKEDITFVVKDTFRQLFTKSLADDVAPTVWTDITNDIWDALGDDITKRTQELAANELAEPDEEDMIFGI